MNLIINTNLFYEEIILIVETLLYIQLILIFYEALLINEIENFKLSFPFKDLNANTILGNKILINQVIRYDYEK
ncbi:MAG: hypothetical protein RR738_01745 [Anaerorhabdus sp.]|uniref:hypothetical protein n=1 Tax=Anaerorhabdus sp. TaxID=1872524 RepID=UPI002FCCA7CE